MVGVVVANCAIVAHVDRFVDETAAHKSVFMN